MVGWLYYCSLNNLTDADLVDKGVPALPPSYVGYRHLCRSPIYLVKDRLYRVPESEMEHALFHTTADDATEPMRSPQFPLGGHNYYNGRDMEKLTRRMEWVSKMMAGNTSWDQWEDLYRRKVELQEKRSRSASR